MAINKRSLGKTGIQVSEIAFGGVEIGIPYGIGVKDHTDMLTHQEAIHLLHAALDNGINFFDTARLYGESETIMGKAFHDRRDRIVLATKCTHFRDADGKIPSYQELKQIIEDSLAVSLKELQTDYVDLYMLHQSDTEILENEDVARVFSDLLAKGVIRSRGASTYNVAESKLAIEKNWDVLQLPFNLMDQRQQEIFGIAEERGTGIVVRSVLMKGLLSVKGRNLHPALSEVESHIGGFSKLLTHKANDISQLATKFALSFKEVSTVLVGIDRLAYLEQSVHNADGNYFESDQLSILKAAAYPDPGFLDLPKWDRLGWLK